MKSLSRLATSGLVALGLGASAPPVSADLGLALEFNAGSSPLAARAQEYLKKSEEGTSNLKLLANVEPSAPGVVQSDLAFEGKLAYAGNYQGFRVIDIRNRKKPKVITSFDCNGAQGDLSVYGGLLFQSVDTPQSSPDCDSINVDATTQGAWEGVRVFDVSDPEDPIHLDSYKIDCGAHTHTLVPDPDNDRVFIYVSSYPLAPSGIGPESNCFDKESGGGHGYISIIEVPLSDPTNETVTRYFLDPGTEVATFNLDVPLGLPPGTLGTHSFVGCHDISVFVELGLAATACLSEAQLWDISDPAHPMFLWRFDDLALDHEFGLDLWHSAAFTWDGEVVAFGDESGGGALARCEDPNNDRGRVWFLDIGLGDFLANYKIPRSEPGVCTAHNFNFIPQKRGRKTLVLANYTAGVSVVNVNELLGGAPEAEAEVGFLKPENADQWSAYWYNGLIYVNDINRGVDVIRLRGRDRKGAKKLKIMNPQTQMKVFD